MNPAVVLKCKKPELMREWTEKKVIADEKWKEDTARIAKELGKETLTMREGGLFRCVTGYQENDRNEPPLEGFRKDSKTGYMLPAKKTPEGREWAKRLNAVSLDFGNRPGLPNIVMGERYLGPFKVEEIGSDWFASLTFNADSRDLNEVDYDVWESVKLSEYYVAVENK